MHLRGGLHYRRPRRRPCRRLHPRVWRRTYSGARQGRAVSFGGVARFGVVGGSSWVVSRGRLDAGDVARSGPVACARTSNPFIMASSVLRM